LVGGDSGFCKQWLPARITVKVCKEIVYHHTTKAVYFYLFLQPDKNIIDISNPGIDMSYFDWPSVSPALA